MVTVKIPYLKRKSSGFYWEPTPRLREVGFLPEALGRDAEIAVAKALTLNAQIDNALTAPSQQILPGSVAEVLHLYRQDHVFKSKAPKTRKEYERCLSAIEKWAGKMQITSISRKTVKVWYRKMAEKTPAQAAAIIRVLSVVMKFAMDEDYIEVNPASQMRLQATGGNTLGWSDAQIRAVCEAATREGRESIRLAVLLSLHLGQRKGDVIRMTWNQYDGSHVAILQNKTKTRLRLPVAQELKTALDNAVKKSPLIVISEATGKPYGEFHFSDVFAEVRKKAGVPSEYKFMGLRHTAAQRLGDAGCTEDEIRAVTGHKSRSVVSTYVRPSSTMAEAAMSKLRSGDKSDD